MARWLATAGEHSVFYVTTPRFALSLGDEQHGFDELSPNGVRA